MPFGAINAPAAFQRHMNQLLAPFIDKFAVTYLNDIFTFSKTHSEHEKHVNSRVGNRPSVTRHWPNRRPRFFDVVSSRIEHKGQENENRPSEICSINPRPISSSRSKTDETNRFRVDQIVVTGIVIIIQQNAGFLRRFYLFEL